MSVKMNLIITATTKEEMEYVANIINKQIDELYSKVPNLGVDLKPTIVNDDKSITESITIIIGD